VDCRTQEAEADDENRHADEGEHAERHRQPHAGDEHTDADQETQERSHGLHDVLATSRRRNTNVAAITMRDRERVTGASATTGPRVNRTLSSCAHVRMSVMFSPQRNRANPGL